MQNRWTVAAVAAVAFLACLSDAAAQAQSPGCSNGLDCYTRALARLQYAQDMYAAASRDLEALKKRVEALEQRPVPPPVPQPTVVPRQEAFYYSGRRAVPYAETTAFEFSTAHLTSDQVKSEHWRYVANRERRLLLSGEFWTDVANPNAGADDAARYYKSCSIMVLRPGENKPQHLSDQQSYSTLCNVSAIVQLRAGDQVWLSFGQAATPRRDSLWVNGRVTGISLIDD